MNLEQEIMELKQRIAVAEQDGRNPLAIQAKFDNAFHLITEMQNQIDFLNQRISEELISDEVQGENVEPLKRKPGRPARQEV